MGAISKSSGTPASELFLAQDKYEQYVKLHKWETPTDYILVGGLKHLSALPPTLKVDAYKLRDAFENAEHCMQFQEVLIEAYSQEKFQKAKLKLQARFIAQNRSVKEYPRVLRDVMLPIQNKIWPQWGFDTTPKGRN